MSSQAVSAAFEDELVRPISRLNGAIAQHTGRQCLHKTRTLIELHKDGVLPGVILLDNGRYAFRPSAVPEIARSLPPSMVNRDAYPQQVGAAFAAEVPDVEATSAAGIGREDAAAVSGNRSVQQRARRPEVAARQPQAAEP